MNITLATAAQVLFAFLSPYIPSLSKLVLSRKNKIEIRQVETRYKGEHYGTAWLLLHVEEKDPYGSFYYVVTTREGEGRWRIVWKGCMPDMRHKVQLRHIVADCINEVYLDVGPLTFYIGY